MRILKSEVSYQDQQLKYLRRLEKIVQINIGYVECKIGTSVWEQEFLTKLGIR